MITNNIKNISNYIGISLKLDKVIEFIVSHDLNNVTLGKHYITEDIFLIKSEYETKNHEECLYEAHKKFIDLQIILDGEESIYGADVSFLNEEIPYDAEKEALFLKGGHQWHILCQTGTFAIFTTDDGHMPGVTLHEKSNVTKVVFKINDK